MKWPLSFAALCCCVAPVLCNDISTNVFGDDRDDLLPAAFGDFNSDGLIDVFVTRRGGRVLEILLANEREPLLRSRAGMRCETGAFTIRGVVPGDFDGDAFMDVMLVTQNDDGDDLYDARPIWGGVDELNCTTLDAPVVSGMKGEPLALDYNRDMIVDLFGMNSYGDRCFWIFDERRAGPTQLCDYGPEIRTPHSNSFLDVNGDHVADLVVMTFTSIEVWLGNVRDVGFTYYKSYDILIGPLEGNVGQALFLDVELSGRLYLLLPYCYNADCSNSTLMLYDDDDDDEDRKWKNLLLKFEDDNNNMWGFRPPTTSDAYGETITLRGGDYNMDGYPDLLVTLYQRNGNGESQTFLMENVPCTASGCTFKRSYKILWNALAPFERGTVLSTFYDFYQDGVLDYIVVQKNYTSKTYRVGALRNELDYDANFIKVMVLTGLTNARRPETIGPWGKKKGNYGTNLPGPRISYSTLSHDGSRRDGVCAQLPQSAYYSLSLPYSTFGLGKTPNFVDALTVGLANRSKTWTQLIPNSQIVVVPQPLNDSSQWRVQLFVTPGKTILKSAWVFGGVCGLVALAVLALDRKERRDDKRAERDEEVETVL